MASSWDQQNVTTAVTSTSFILCCCCCDATGMVMNISISPLREILKRDFHCHMVLFEVSNNQRILTLADQVQFMPLSAFLSVFFPRLNTHTLSRYFLRVSLSQRKKETHKCTLSALLLLFFVAWIEMVKILWEWQYYHSEIILFFIQYLILFSRESST